MPGGVTGGGEVFVKLVSWDRMHGEQREDRLRFGEFAEWLCCGMGWRNKACPYPSEQGWDGVELTILGGRVGFLRRLSATLVRPVRRTQQA